MVGVRKVEWAEGGLDNGRVNLYSNIADWDFRVYLWFHHLS